MTEVRDFLEKIVMVDGLLDDNPPLLLELTTNATIDLTAVRKERTSLTPILESSKAGRLISGNETGKQRLLKFKGFRVTKRSAFLLSIIAIIVLVGIIAAVYVIVAKSAENFTILLTQSLFTATTTSVQIFKTTENSVFNSSTTYNNPPTTLTFVSNLITTSTATATISSSRRTGIWTVTTLAGSNVGYAEGIGPSASLKVLLLIISLRSFTFVIHIIFD